MGHKYSVGAKVYLDSTFGPQVAGSEYTIIRLVLVERDTRLIYRIKSPAETFERTAEEHQLKTSFA
jgi:hypothetical protein